MKKLIAKIDGREYEVRAQFLASQFPNLAKYLKTQFWITGQRGAEYSLCERTNGTWFMQNLGCNETPEIKSISFLEALQ